MPRFTDTIAALATPAGTAAIAVLRASGPDAAKVAAKIFGAPPPPRLVHHADYHARGGELLDDVLVTYFRGPHSYTGEDSLEISCHGNPFIAQKILEDLFARGCRPAQPGEFTQRAFLNGKMDLSQAEAVMDLIHARSERALAAANQQLRGSLGRRMADLIERLLAITARVEAYIDFPEEDLPAEDRGTMARELNQLLRDTEGLIATSHYGELLRDGIKTVIIGAPNAGKSSVLNRLVGRDRALVSPEPGTTRDFIEERITIGQHLLRIIDTAGLNVSPSPLEKLGMEKTLERAAEADLVLIVLDSTRSSPTLAPELLLRVRAENAVILANKSDLCAPNMATPTLSGITSAVPLIRISALTGDGFDALGGKLIELADSFQIGAGNEIVAINARHADALAQARACLSEALTKVSKPAGIMELLASDLNSALSAYSDISGKVDNERMLDHLFASFCIGK